MRFTRGRVLELKNAHNSVTVQNRKYVYMNFFHKNLGNHLLQLCPKVVKHPVYFRRLEDIELLCFGHHNSENGCKYVCIGLECVFYVSDCLVVWKILGDEFNADTQLCII